MVVARPFVLMIGTEPTPMKWFPASVKTPFPNRTTLILAGIAFVLISAAIAINYFRGGNVEFVHVLFALGLLGFVVWFSGRRDPAE